MNSKLFFIFLIGLVALKEVHQGSASDVKDIPKGPIDIKVCFNTTSEKDSPAKLMTFVLSNRGAMDAYEENFIDCIFEQFNLTKRDPEDPKKILLNDEVFERFSGAIGRGKDGNKKIEDIARACGKKAIEDTKSTKSIGNRVFACFQDGLKQPGLQEGFSFQEILEKLLS